jgi:hypothetical protein
VYKSYPKGAWFLGVLFLLSGSILLYLITVHFHIFLDEIDGLSIFWKYVIIVLMQILGLIFLSFGEIEVIEFNKKLNLIITVKKNIFFYIKRKSRILDELITIYLIKRGHESVT